MKIVIPIGVDTNPSVMLKTWGCSRNDIMAAKKYQVFVSSTFRDLMDERQDAIRNILDLNHIPAGMELFPAADQDQLTYIKKVIDECDYYVLIVGGRYGSMDADGVSYTEREYDYAVEKGMVVLAFVHDDPAAISVGKSDIRPELLTSLNTFRSKVMSGRLVRTWTTRQNLEPLVLKALMHAFNNMPQVGWIRGNAAANEDVLLRSNDALEENARLRAELSMLKAVRPRKFDNLADLNDKITIKYTYRYSSPRGTIYPAAEATFTWKELFISLASELTTSKTDSVILIAFRHAAVEANVSPKPHDINDLDAARIKVQFVALGLITATVSKTTQGGAAEFLALTETGRNTFIENMIVRR